MLELFFSFRGRINRQPYWLATLLMTVLMIALIFASLSMGLAAGGLALVIMLAYIPIVWAGFALGVKRLHDRDKSGWWLVLFYFVPGLLQGISHALGEASWGLSTLILLVSFALSIWGLVEIGFLKGTPGPNRYGPDPLGELRPATN